MAFPDLQKNRTRRGFTLIELMVVVVIIGILAVIAVPSVAERLRERRSQEAADRIASFYRAARMRAMGRGAAVSVQYKSGAFTIVEAVQEGAAAAGCLLPYSSCTIPEGSTQIKQTTLSAVDITKRGEYENVKIEAGDGVTAIDVCYTPLGRAYSRTTESTFSPLGRVLTFDVSRTTGGITRTVTLLPNGIARVVAQRVE